MDDTLRTKLNELEKAAQAMAEAMYQQQQSQGQSASASADDEVIDADFTSK